MKAIALTCPLCAGAVNPPLDSRQVTCGYCGKRLHYRGEDFLPRLALVPGLTPEALQRRFFEILRGVTLPSDLPRRAVVLHKRRLHFPLYVVGGTRAGILNTVKERMVYDPRAQMASYGGGDAPTLRDMAIVDSLRPKVEATADARVVLGDFLYVYSGAAAEEWDFDASVLQEKAKKRLEEARPASLESLGDGGEILEATIPVDRVLEMGVASWKGASGGGPDLLETSVRILYVPLVEIVFRYGEQVHSVLIEELEGSVLAGRLPFRRELAFVAGMPLAGLMGMVLGKSARVLIPGLSPLGPATAQEAMAGWTWLGIIAVVLFGFGFHLLWLLLKAPVEVELMTGGGSKIRVSEDLSDAPTARLNRFLVALLRHLDKGVEP